jgi:CRP-like cAMP-binding protein
MEKGATDPLSAVPYFSKLTSEQRTRVLGAARHIRADAGQTLFVEGEPCSGLFVIVRGLVKLFKTSVDGKEQVLRHMSAGDTFNEVPVFDGSQNPVSAAAVEPSDVIVLSRETMLGILREYPDVAEAVVQVFASRLRHLVASSRISFRQVTARVARIVLQSVSPHEGVGAGVGGRVRSPSADRGDGRHEPRGRRPRPQGARRGRRHRSPPRRHPDHRRRSTQRARVTRA